MAQEGAIFVYRDFPLMLSQNEPPAKSEAIRREFRKAAGEALQKLTRRKLVSPRVNLESPYMSLSAGESRHGRLVRRLRDNPAIADLSA